jgi:hypothetical protein
MAETSRLAAAENAINCPLSQPRRWVTDRSAALALFDDVFGRPTDEGREDVEESARSRTQMDRILDMLEEERIEEEYVAPRRDRDNSEW